MSTYIRKTLDLEKLNLNEDELELLNKIVDLETHFCVECLECFESEDDFVDTLYRLRRLNSIKTSLVCLGDELDCEFDYATNTLDCDECKILKELIGEHINRSESNIKGKNRYGEDSSVVDTGVWSTGSPVYNIYIEDIPFLKRLNDALGEIISFSKTDNYPSPGTTIYEYLGLDDEEDDDDYEYLETTGHHNVKIK